MINRRALRKKLGSRVSRRQGTKRGKILKPKAKTRLAELIQNIK